MSEAIYRRRIARALALLEENPARRVGLEELASAAGFAPCHFHRLFKGLVGATPHEYALRLRVERAAFMLKHGDRRRSLLDVALECGFGEASDFSRAFRRHLGVSPSAFRREGRSVRKQRIDGAPRMNWGTQKDPLVVKVEAEPAHRLAFVRVHGSYDAPRLLAGLAQLRAWAKANAEGAVVWGTTTDDPDLTPRAECRYDWCVVAGGSARAEGAVQLRTQPGGQVASLRVRGDFQRVARAWDWLFLRWLPASGFEPRDVGAREEWLDDGREAPTKFDLRLVLPVRPLIARSVKKRGPRRP